MKSLFSLQSVLYDENYEINLKDRDIFVNFAIMHLQKNAHVGMRNLLAMIETLSKTIIHIRQARNFGWEGG